MNLTLDLSLCSIGCSLPLSLACLCIRAAQSGASLPNRRQETPTSETRSSTTCSRNASASLPSTRREGKHNTAESMAEKQSHRTLCTRNAQPCV
eukprot:1041534-Rhodomonas_salina.1